MPRRIPRRPGATTPAINRGTHLAVVQWIRDLRASRGHELLYAGFERLRPFLCGSPDAGDACIAAHDVFAALAYEVSYVLRSYERHRSRDVFLLQNPGARYGKYELQCSRHFIGECGGPHEERIFVLASGWRQYLQRCLDLLWLLTEERLIVVSWPEKGLTQQESEWLCEPLVQRFIEGHRGCWRAYFVSSMFEKQVSQLLRAVGFMPSAAEEGYLDSSSYPPDASIFANSDDEIFSNVLRGVAKSRSAVARIVLSRFQTDDEDSVRNLAIQLLSDFSGT